MVHGLALLDGISIVATDLDGTLLRSDGTVSEWTRGRLLAAAEMDVTVVVVTARPPRWLGVIEGLHLHGYAIGANGAVVIDLEQNTEISTISIDPDTIGAVAELIRARVPLVRFAVETAGGFGYEPGYEAHWPVEPGTPVGDVLDLVERLGGSGPIKLLARSSEFGGHALDEVSDLVGHLCSVSYSGGSELIELGPHGTSKGAALASLVADLDATAADVVAVGDMPNDLSMLEWAGRAAAVANAHRDLLAIADVTIPSNDDDGVGHLVDGVLSIRSAGRADR